MIIKKETNQNPQNTPGSFLKKNHYFKFISALLCLVGVVFLQTNNHGYVIRSASAKTIDVSEADLSYNTNQNSSVFPVRLELKQKQSSTKVIGSTVIEDKPNIPYTIVETTFVATARAFGGDLYLPTYLEDIVSSSVFNEPREGSNAVVAGMSSVEILDNLPKIGDKFLLKEYQSVDLRIKISYKILPKAMPGRIVFSPRLDTVLWYPTVYQNGQYDPGVDPQTGQRLIQIPLVQATYIPQQVTRVDWKGEPVILLKANGFLSALKENLQSQKSAANVRNIFLQIFSR